MKFSKPKERKFGANLHRCRKCGKTSGVTVKYGLYYCRQCFREEAEKLGFRKYS
ncbi:MAG: 30S ribosomal protein S14 [Candidatus Aenigmarchaeota archaeon]|nr:30S ribosomal protein S14 [Candidatus Aenigmarchaeota archaeon]